MQRDIYPQVNLIKGAVLSYLHYGDVSVQDSEGEGCPMATIRMHRGVFWGAWWHLAAQDKAQRYTQISRSYPPKNTTIRGSLQPLCPEFNHIYRHVQVGPGIDQHLDQGLVSSRAGVHQRRHPLRDKQSYIGA